MEAQKDEAIFPAYEGAGTVTTSQGSLSVSTPLCCITAPTTLLVRFHFLRLRQDSVGVSQMCIV